MRVLNPDFELRGFPVVDFFKRMCNPVVIEENVSTKSPLVINNANQLNLIECYDIISFSRNPLLPSSGNTLLVLDKNNSTKRLTVFTLEAFFSGWLNNVGETYTVDFKDFNIKRVFIERILSLGTPNIKEWPHTLSSKYVSSKTGNLSRKASVPASTTYVERLPRAMELIAEHLPKQKCKPSKAALRRKRREALKIAMPLILEKKKQEGRLKAKNMWGDIELKADVINVDSPIEEFSDVADGIEIVESIDDDNG
jgi:hypothetical protein